MRRTIVAFGVVLVVAAGCGGPPVPSRPAAAPPGDAATAAASDPFPAVRDALRKEPDEPGCRTAVQQLNFAIGQQTDPAQKPPALADADKAALADKEGWGFQPHEIAAVARSEFDALDAAYLEECVLFADAIDSLRLDGRPAAERAAAALAWAARQCGPAEPGPFAPPGYAARRGWGTFPDRTGVAQAALRQAGFDPVLVGSSPAPDKTNILAVGVPADGEILLFARDDGRPLAADGKPVTLRQLRADAPTLLPKLGDAVKGVTPETAKDARVLVTAPFVALAPRMKFLQEKFGPGLRLAADIRPDLDALSKAAGGAAARVWNPPGRADTPARALAYFLTPDDGGFDRPTKERPPVRLVFMQQLAPLDRFPEFFLRLPPGLANDLRTQFAGPFLALLSAPKQPRDQVLRGQLSGAEEALVAQRQQWADLKRNVDRNPAVAQEINKWLSSADQTIRDLEAARKAGAQESFDAALERMKGLVASADLVRYAVARLAYDVFDGELVYQLALCKHEQAVRARDAAAAGRLWASAEGWWGTYLAKSAGGNALNPARRALAERLRAEARARLKD